MPGLAVDLAEEGAVLGVAAWVVGASSVASTSVALSVQEARKRMSSKGIKRNMGMF